MIEWKIRDEMKEGKEVRGREDEAPIRVINRERNQILHQSQDKQIPKSPSLPLYKEGPIEEVGYRHTAVAI